MLRGKPVGVCASLHETSCLIAASKEAKALGIKTGTLVYKAKKLCPKIILLRATPAKYREVNRHINRIFADYTDRVETYSIDESFLDLSFCSSPSIGEVRRGRDKALLSTTPSPSYSRRGIVNPLQIGAEIKKRIKQEVGEWLTCSIGIAPNKFMAKLAADLQKPDGLSIVWRENLPEVYKDKKLTDLWGIASGWERRLARLGILSPLQLLGYPVQNLISVFGKPGFYIWQRVNGLEVDEIRNWKLEISSQNPISDFEFPISDGPKSFGHSWVLNFRTTDKERLKPVILRLAEKAARRMREEGFQAYGIGLSITLVDGIKFGRPKPLNHAVDTGLGLYYEALKIWEPWKFEKEVMHIAVRFFNLVKYSRQLELNYGLRITNWNNPQFAIRNKPIPLVQYLDTINNKYGEFTIRSGLLTKTQDYTPDAIAFGR